LTAPTGFKPVDATAIVRSWPLARRDGGDARAKAVKGLIGILGEQLRTILRTEDFAQQPIDPRRILEPAVEQDIGDLGLFLHVVGERDLGCSGAAAIKYEIRFELQHILKVSCTPAPR
jgi:hypothetical protein